MGFDANKANEKLLKELEKQDREFLEKQRKQDEEFVKKFAEELMSRADSTILAKKESNASLKKGIEKANKETEKIIANSEPKIKKAIEKFKNSTEFEIGGLSISKKNLKEFDDSAEQMLKTIDNVMNNVQKAATKARKAKDIINGIDLNTSLQDNVKKSIPKSSKKEQEYVTKLLTANVELEKTFKSNLNKVYDEESGKKAIIVAQEYKNTLEETLNIVEKIKVENNGLIDTSQIKAKLGIINTAMSGTGRIMENSLKPINSSFEELIDMLNNLSISGGAIVGKRPKKEDYYKKNLYKKEVNTGRYDIQQYLNWDNDNHTRNTRKELQSLFNRFDEYGRAQTRLSGEVQARFVGLLSKALAEENLDIKNPDLKDVKEKISDYANEKALKYYRSLVDKTAQNARENYNAELEVLANNVYNTIFSKPVVTDTDPSKITKEHQKIIDILNKEKLESKEIVSIFEEFAKLSEDEKISISNILGDNKNLKDLLGLIKKTNGDLEKTKELLGLVGGQGGKSGNGGSGGNINTRKTLKELADQQREEGNVTEYNGKDWKYSKDSIIRYAEGIKNLQNQISQTTDAKILDDLNRDLEDAKINFIALYDTVNSFFDGKLDNKRSIKAEIRNLYSSLIGEEAKFDTHFSERIVSSTPNTSLSGTPKEIANQNQLQKELEDSIKLVEGLERSLNLVTNGVNENSSSEFLKTQIEALKSFEENLISIEEKVKSLNLDDSLKSGVLGNISELKTSFETNIETLTDWMNKAIETSTSRNLEEDVSSFITTVSQLENYKSADPQWLVDYTDKIRKNEIDLSTALDEYKNKLAEKMQEIADEQERNRINGEQIQIFVKEFGDTSNFDEGKLTKYGEILSQVSSGALSAADGIEKFKKAINSVETTITTSPSQSNAYTDKIKELEDNINRTSKFLLSIDTKDGILSKYLFGQDGTPKTQIQLIEEVIEIFNKCWEQLSINSEKFGWDKAQEKFKNGIKEAYKLMTVLESQTSFEKISELTKGYFDIGYKGSHRSEYEKWYNESQFGKRFNNRFGENSEHKDNVFWDYIQEYGNMIVYQEKLNTIRQIGEEKYISLVEKEKGLLTQVWAIKDKYKGYSELDPENITISQDEAQQKISELKTESLLIQDIITGLKECKEIEPFSDIYLPGQIRDLEHYNELIEKNIYHYETFERIQKNNAKSREDKMLTNYLTNKMKRENEYPRELELYWEELSDAILDGLLKGQEAIEKFDTKCKELGYTFDEVKGKWIRLETTPTLPSGEETSSLQQEEVQVKELIEDYKELLDLKYQIKNVNKSLYSGKYNSDWIGIYSSQEEAIATDLADRKEKLHSSLNLILSEDKQALSALEEGANRLKASLQPVQDMVDRISSNSSITYLDTDKGSENWYKGYAEAYKEIDDRLGELNHQYSLTNEELEEYITLQVKAEKIMDKMISNSGGVQCSGAKNKTELKTWIEKSFARDLGLNPEDIYNGLFGNITDALYDGNDISLFDSEGTKRNLREVSAEILKYEGITSYISGAFGANEDAEKLRVINTVLNYIKKNINEIKATDFTSQIQKATELVNDYLKVFPEGGAGLEDAQKNLQELIALQERLNSAQGKQSQVDQVSPTLPLFNEESTGQLAMQIEGVTEASWDLGKAEKFTAEDMSFMNTTLEGQIELLDYLAEKENEAKKNEVEQEEQLTSVQKRRIAQQKRYNELKKEENQHSREAVEIVRELLKQVGLNPSNEITTRIKLAAEYDDSKDMNKVLDILADRVINSNNVEYLKELEPDIYEIIDTLKTIKTIKYSTSDVEAFGNAWEFVQEKVGKSHFSLTKGTGWDMIDFSESLKSKIYKDTNDVVSGLSQILNDGLFISGKNKLHDVLKEQFINNGLDKIGSTSQEESKIVIKSFEDIEASITSTKRSLNELLEILEQTAKLFGRDDLITAMEDIDKSPLYKDLTYSNWEVLIDKAHELDKKYYQNLEEPSLSSTPIIVENEKKQKEAYEDTAKAAEDKAERVSDASHKIISTINSNDMWSKTYQDESGRTFTVGERRNKKTDEWEPFSKELTSYTKFENEAIVVTNKLADAYVELKKAQRNNASTSELDAHQQLINYLEEEERLIRKQASDYFKEQGLGKEYTEHLFDERVSKKTDEHALKLKIKTVREIRKENEANVKVIKQQQKEQDKVNGYLDVTLNTLKKSNNRYGNNINKPLDATSLQQLESKRQETENIINSYRNKKELSDVDKAKLKSVLTDFDLFAKELQDKVYAQIQLNAKNVDENLEKVRRKLKSLIIDMKKVGDTSSNLYNQAETLLNELDGKKDQNGNILKLNAKEVANISSQANILGNKISVINNAFKDGYNAIQKYEQAHIKLNELYMKEQEKGSSAKLTADIEVQKKAVSELKKEAIDASKEINKMFKEGSISSEQRANALNTLIDAYRGKTPSDTALSTVKQEQQNKAVKNLEDLISKLEKAGNYTSDLQEKATNLWVKLNETDSKDNLLQIAEAIKNISEEFEQLKTAHDAEIQKQKEIQAQYDKNIEAIKQLEIETDKLNNMMASDIGKNKKSNQIEDQLNKTIEAAKNAKKAIEDVNQMFKDGNISKGQQMDAGDKYREAKQGSTTSQARYEDAKASEAKAQATKNEKAAVDNLKESLNNLISAYTHLTSVSTKPGENSFTNALEQVNKSRTVFGDMYKAAQDAGINSEQLLDIQLNALVKLNESVSQAGAKAFDSYITKIDEAMNKLRSLGQLTPEAFNEFSDLAQKLKDANLNKDLSSFDGIQKYIQNIAKYSSIVDEEVRRISQGSQIGYFETQITEFDQMNVKSVRFISVLEQVKQRLKEFSNFKAQTSDKQLISDKEVQLIKQLSPMINELYKEAQGKGTLIPESIGKVTDIKSLENSMVEYAESLGYTTRASQSVVQENGQLTISFKNSKGEILKMTGSIDALNQGLRETSTVSKTTGGFITNLKTSFGQMLGYFTRYYTGYTMMTRAISSFREGISIVKEFDAAMTELIKVSNDSEEVLRRFGSESFDIANSIGSTGKEIINSAADWEKLGYAIEDASELAKNSALYSNVGDMDIDTATEHMVSTLKAYKEFDAKNSQLIVDKFNEIGNNYAITSEGIGAALERSASTLVAAGKSNCLNI